MRHWLRALIVLVLAAVLAPASPAEAQPTIVLKFAHITPTTFPYHDGALKFKEVLERISGGRVEVQVFPAAQLGGERDINEGIRLGTIHIGVGAGALAGFAPIYNIVELPFLIKNQDHMERVSDGPAGKLLARRIEEQSGLKVLGFWSTGDSGIQTVKAPVRTPDDLKGVKIRVMENQALIESTRALGATPTPMPFPEVYTAMKQGVVEGAHLDYTALYTTRVYETVKFITEPGFHFLAEPRPVIMSQKFFASLPANVQQEIQQAADEAIRFQRRLFRERQQKAIDELRARGITFTRIDEKAFLERLQPIWRKIARDLKAEDLLEEIIKATP
jgi:tripartite ATP-independent transporter DctP family solute receptor